MTMDEIEILDPTGESESSGWRLSPPLDLAGSAHFGLLDISKPKGDVFLDELERLLVEQGHRVTRYRKPTMARPAGDSLVGEMARACDAAVIALAD